MASFDARVRFTVTDAKVNDNKKISNGAIMEVRKVLILCLQTLSDALVVFEVFCKQNRITQNEYDNKD